MGVAEMPSVFTGLAKTPPDRSIMPRAPPLVYNKRNGLMTTSVKDTLGDVDSILERPFLYYFRKRGP